MKKFNVAVVQMDIVAGDKEANLETVAELVSSASEKGANFVCLPEYVSTGSVFEQFSDLAESIPGDTTQRLGEMAKANGVHLVASVAEKSDGNFYNTGILIDPNGELLAKHRKMHLFLDENAHVSKGKDYVVVDTEFGKIGLTVCYDAIFPELARELALQGAEVVFVPANWPEPFLLQWQLATSARALDNQIWVVATNRIGTDQKFTYFGCSRIVSPYGDAVVECGNEKGVSIATIDGDAPQGFKQIINFLNDRRQEGYN